MLVDKTAVIASMLQDSLGGTAQVALIVCCSPAAQDASESLSALRFGTRAAGIVNSLQVSSPLPPNTPLANPQAERDPCQTNTAAWLKSNIAGKLTSSLCSCDQVA